MTALPPKPLDDGFFKGVSTELNGFISEGGGADYKEISAEFRAKNIAYWPETIAGHKKLGDQLKKVRDIAPFVAGHAEEGYQAVIQRMKDKGYETKDFERPIAASTVLATAKEVFGDDLRLVDGKVRPVVDVAKFRAEMRDLTATIKKLEIIQAITRNSAEQDFWALIVDMLQYEESFELIGILAARLLMPQDQRASLDVKLVRVSVLQNKQGKLSIGIVRLGGFIGLAAVNGEPKLAQAVKFIQNPLLGEDVKDRPMNKKKDESQDAYNNRKIAHDNQFTSYKTIMTEMKGHKKDFDALPAATKEKIKSAVLGYTVYTDA